MSKRIFTFGTKKKRTVRKSHIIPRFYLAKFTNPDGKLWVYAKDQNARVSVPEREAVERDFYECSSANNNKQNNVEEWLSLVEDSASNIFAKVADDCALQGKERAAWAIFVSMLFLRTRKVRQQMTEKALKVMSNKLRAPEHLRDLQHDLLQKGRFIFMESLQQSAEKVIAQIESDPAFLQAKSLETTGLRLAKSMAKKCWHILHAPEGAFFVTSDCPVMTAKVDAQGQAQLGYGFDVENVAVMLPITPDKLFVSSPPHFEWWNTFQLNGLFTANLSVVRFAHKNVYAHSYDKSIEELVNLEIDQLIFGQNAFTDPSAD